jgi:nucleoside-diphosphate-sugar epimerase
MVTIDALTDLVMEISGKTLTKVHVDGPTGVRGRTSDNRLIERSLGWAPRQRLQAGLVVTYAWILKQVMAPESADAGRR